eukprot:scaffold2319_cov105-Isochrysis_galbana.AAC.5
MRPHAPVPAHVSRLTCDTRVSHVCFTCDVPTCVMCGVVSRARRLVVRAPTAKPPRRAEATEWPRSGAL